MMSESNEKKSKEHKSKDKPSKHDPCCHSGKCNCHSQRRQEIQLAFAESRTTLNLFSLEVDEPILTIPPFSTGGQLVKIDAMAVVNLKNSVETEFVFIIFHTLLREGVIIAETTETWETTNFGEVTVTTNLSWVDIPPPGVHTYQTRIQFVAVAQLSIAEVQNRSLIATVFPPNQVLPSTIT